MSEWYISYRCTDWYEDQTSRYDVMYGASGHADPTLPHGNTSIGAEWKKKNNMYTSSGM